MEGDISCCSQIKAIGENIQLTEYVGWVFTTCLCDEAKKAREPTAIAQDSSV